ncbi:MAG: DUF4469 domain-containing protein [Treponema sp.]|jgi:hypothetical protein|nr:DUF4469 domain-containing protein [Treponema sp.]
MVEYVLRPNTLDQTGETYRAQVINSESFGTEDLVDYVSRTNAGVSKPEIASIEAAFEDAFAYFLSQGKFFHSPLLRLSLSIRGSFKKDEHPLSKNIHANASVGPLLQEAAEKAGVQHGQETVKWAIERVVDVYTTSVDSRITLGRNLRIEGKGLTLVGDGAAVEFTPISGGTPVTATAGQLAVNTPSLLVLEAPDSLTAGNYHLSVVTAYNGTHEPNPTVHTIPYDVAFAAGPI